MRLRGKCAGLFNWERWESWSVNTDEKHKEITLALCSPNSLSQLRPRAPDARLTKRTGWSPSGTVGPVAEGCHPRVLRRSDEPKLGPSKRLLGTRATEPVVASP